MADADCTRDERRERIVAECNAVRQALQDLLSEYMANVCCFDFPRTTPIDSILISFFISPINAWNFEISEKLLIARARFLLVWI